MTAVMVAMARDLTLPPGIGSVEEPATINTRKALVETYERQHAVLLAVAGSTIRSDGVLLLYRTRPGRAG